MIIMDPKLRMILKVASKKTKLKERHFSLQSKE